jgi:hypothetical protein
VGQSRNIDENPFIHTKINQELMRKMRVIACLLLALFISSAFFVVCNGAVWFEGYNPQEQKIRLNMQHIEEPIENTPASLPVCNLILSETEPHIVNLTIIVSTAALFYQNENFETWLIIDSQEPEKLVGILDSQPSAAGQLYSRQYNVTLSGLGDGAHLIKIRVAGEYYGPDGGNYDCEGSVTVIINDQTNLSPTTKPFPTATIIAVAVLIGVTIIAAVFLKARRQGRKNRPKSLPSTPTFLP